MTNPRNSGPEYSPDDNPNWFLSLSAQEVKHFAELDLITTEQFDRWMDVPENRQAFEEMLKGEAARQLVTGVGGMLCAGVFRIALVVGVICLVVICVVQTCGLQP